MAKYNQGILGPVKGKIGKVVGSKWRGVDYLRSYTDTVHDPQTKKQVAQRDRFKAAVQLAGLLLPVARWGLEPQHKRSPYNALVSQICKLADTPAQLEETRILVARGRLAPLAKVQKSATSSEITVKWATNAGGNAADRVSYLALNAAKTKSVYGYMAAARGDGQVSITLPVDFGDAGCVYLVATNDKQVNSNSVAVK